MVRFKTSFPWLEVRRDASSGTRICLHTHMQNEVSLLRDRVRAGKVIKKIAKKILLFCACCCACCSAQRIGRMLARGIGCMIGGEHGGMKLLRC